jgi:hypothetical protein
VVFVANDAFDRVRTQQARQRMQIIGRLIG